MKLLSILTAGFALTSTAFASEARDNRCGSPARAATAVAPVAPGAPVAPRIMSRTNIGNAVSVSGNTRRSLMGAFDSAAAPAAEARVSAEEVAESFARMRIAR